ncbi:MAG TPA: Rieske 2Fe-2S domain-containing protein [Burkholderiales bacterium]|nr:Rieske 2Fe-2S domain-containing protein [Burkholderiales bacterium]
MAGKQRLICRSDQLRERGKGWRFTVELLDGEPAAAFAVRYRGRVYAYLNRCAHVGVELDWTEGEFFDFSGLYLVCATHGAAYHPDSGRCAGGPCRGGRLTPLPLVERDGCVFLAEEEETDDTT